MDVKAPSPETTLLILLGASEWPLSPEFRSSQAFAKAAQRVKAYFLNPWPFGLPAENLLDLFDADMSADELDVAIRDFLRRRLAAMKALDNPARDLLLYFIGHGGFVGHDSDFFLAIRRTREDNKRASALQMLSLADRLDDQANHLRRVIILDCCFAAAAFSAFQSGPAEVALAKTADRLKVNRKAEGFPTKGTTLLCSSNHKSPSMLLPDGSSTMFTRAFLDALVEGVTVRRDRLSLRDVIKEAADLLHEIPNAPRPVVHSPDQSEGDVADILFFPNAWIEKERLREAEEAKRRQAEEQARRMEEERLRKAQVVREHQEQYQREIEAAWANEQLTREKVISLSGKESLLQRQLERNRKAQEEEQARLAEKERLARAKPQHTFKEQLSLWLTSALPRKGRMTFRNALAWLFIIGLLGLVLYSIIANLVTPDPNRAGDIIIEIIIASILIIGIIQVIRE